MSDESTPYPGGVSSVIDIARSTLGDGRPGTDREKAAEPSGDRQVDRLKAVISLVVVGFAGVTSYIGLQGADLTTVMRNQSLLVQLMGLFVLFAVITAILSVFVHELDLGDRLTFGMELAVVLAQLAVFGVIEAFTPMPFVTGAAQRITGWVTGGVLALAALGALTRGWPLPAGQSLGPSPGEGTWALGKSEGGSAITLAGSTVAKQPRRWAFLRRPADHNHLYLFLLVVSLLFTSMAVYTALRLEVRDQLTAGVGLQANIEQSGRYTILNLDISASHLATQDFLVVNVNALESPDNIASICSDQPTPKGQYPCTSDPCDAGNYPLAATYCRSLVGWDIPPDTTGEADRQLTLPFSTARYQRLHITTAVCERATSTAACNYDVAQTNHIDLAIPSA
jgi:hypothetical protein